MTGFFSPSCTYSTDRWESGFSADTIFKQPQTVEDRFIGIADSKKFLHDPHDTCTHAADSGAEARYRRTLASKMGLGGGGLMQFDNKEHASKFPRLELDGGGSHLVPPGPMNREAKTPEKGGRPQPSMRNADFLTQTDEEPHDGFHTPPSTPVKNRIDGVRIRFQSYHGTTSAVSSPMPASTAHLDVGDDCRTPPGLSRKCGMRSQELRTSAVEVSPSIGSPYNWTQRGDAHWTTPVRNSVGVASLGYGPRGSDAVGAVTTSPNPGRNANFHSASSPQLRTPVRNENHILQAESPGGHTGNVAALQGVSPVSRRSVFYSHHVAQHLKLKRCCRVLAAEGLSLCDSQGRPTFSPLSWGYMGAVVALQRSVYLWQESVEACLLFETPAGSTLVTAVTSSRRPTEVGDLYLAIGMSDGAIVVLKYHVGDGVSIGWSGSQTMPPGVMAEERNQTFFKGSMSHVSTLHVVGHVLYSGCMDGTLTVRNLRDGSVSWHTSTEVMDRGLFTYKSFPVEYSVTIGAPIYKVEVAPDGEHIAVGTTDSLFVYQTNSMGPGNRTRCRVVFSGASQPVRAFCWWTLPFNTSNDSAVETHHIPSSGGKFDFLHSVLIYGGGSDGSVLSAYCVGSRCHKAMYCLPAPILAIVSSDTSEEIIVSVDASDVEVGHVRHAEESEAAPATDGSVNINVYDANDSRLGNFNSWGFSDSSGEEEEIHHVSYVDRHDPIWFTQQSHHRIHGSRAGGIASGNASVQGHHLFLGMEAAGAPPALPHMRSPPSDSTEGVSLLQLFRLKDGGASFERLGGLCGLNIASLYMALSPDGSLLSTAGSELKLRIWRDCKSRSPERVAQCAFR
ncbi:uncharacterized protein Tco025E_02356 [Trypanosoma conorhini]|uniref:Uncharacterized protein n=1 Tax=Trypanosoma conorhini TaxID=83891 RepID=A0A3R7NXI0_9TRYP|nr:uncharacterized protein Tco025E_02356 [Trypanosoma conorhini]RNF25333.1 hypothetical protein Tco025E_02356 [Trypanosoma conorhini]